MTQKVTIMTFLAVLFLVCANAAYAGAPQVISYQGRLVDESTGQALDGQYDITFTLNIVPVPTQPAVWHHSFVDVEVVDGLFNVLLGYGTPSEPLTPEIVNSASFLGMTVGEYGVDPELLPRVQLVSTPFAMIATVADSANTVGDDAINSIKIADATIEFVDVASNGASEGDVMKWVDGAWTASPDESGAATGWVDDGSNVYLETAEDRVGIGTDTPSEKLDVEGNIHASGVVTSGNSLTFDGVSNIITSSTKNIGFDSDTLSGAHRLLFGTPDYDYPFYPLDIRIDRNHTHTVGIYVTNHNTGSSAREGLYFQEKNHFFTTLEGIPDAGLEVWNNSDKMTLFNHRDETPSIKISLGGVDEYVTLVDGGNFGIGTETPSEKLDVAGNIHASGSITSGASITIDGTLNEITSSASKISFSTDTVVAAGPVLVGQVPTPPPMNAGLHVFRDLSTMDATVGILTDIKNSLGNDIVGVLNFVEASNATDPEAITIGSLSEARSAEARVGLVGLARPIEHSDPPADYSVGVDAISENADEVYGVRSSAENGTDVYGVHGEADGGTRVYGIYGTARNGSLGTWAGYFDGNVNVTSSLYCNMGYIGSSTASEHGTLDLYKVGTDLSVIEAFGWPEGANFSLWDESGIHATVEMGSDTDGEGGYLSVLGNASGTTGLFLDGNSSGTGDPKLTIAGSASTFEVATNATSNAAVVLADSAISSPEILDEPGIASENSTGSTTLTNTSMIDIETVTIRAPNAGYIVVQGQCMVRFYLMSSANKANIQIDDDSGGSTEYPYYMTVGFNSYPTTDMYFLPVFVQRVFGVAAGEYTYRLEGSSTSSIGQVSAWQPTLVATYYPTSYGTVATVSSDPGDYPEAVVAQTATDPVSGSSVNMYEMDLRYYELQAEKTRREAADARVKALEAEMALNRARRVADRENR